MSEPPFHPIENAVGLTLTYACLIIVPLWPLVFCIRANRAYYRLEAWRRMQVEHRIAAGMASPTDYYHYIQDAKEDAYNEGYSAGRRSGNLFKKW